MIFLEIALASGAVYAFRRLQKRRTAQRKLSDLIVVPPSPSTDSDTVEADSWVEATDEQYLFSKPIVRNSLIGGGLLVLAGMWVLPMASLNPLTVTGQLMTYIGNHVYSLLLYTTLYGVSPLVMFPASLLTLTGGLLFGPVQGFAYAFVGNTFAAMFGYTLGQTMELNEFREDTQELIDRYRQPLLNHPFATLFTMRVVPVPYQLSSYLSGFLQVPWQSFLIASMIGAIPGTLGMVLFSASITGYTYGLPQLHLPMLALSAAVVGGSYVLLRYLRRNRTLLEAVDAELSAQPNVPTA